MCVLYDTCRYGSKCGGSQSRRVIVPPRFGVWARSDAGDGSTTILYARFIRSTYLRPILQGRRSKSHEADHQSCLCRGAVPCARDPSPGGQSARPKGPGPSRAARALRALSVLSGPFRPDLLLPVSLLRLLSVSGLLPRGGGREVSVGCFSTRGPA